MKMTAALMHPEAGRRVSDAAHRLKVSKPPPLPQIGHEDRGQRRLLECPSNAQQGPSNESLPYYFIRPSHQIC
jgi:hypothetical protein